MIGVLWRYFREPPGRPHPRARAPGGQLLGTVGAAVPRLPARHPQVAAEYEALKRRLDVRYRDDRRGYAAAKEPFSWAVIHRADGWAQAQGWQRGPSDT